jgi:ketopantoate reductase
MQQANNLPIYIIGDTPIAYFLTAKLTLGGECVILLGERNPLKNANSFLYKDNISSQKNTITVPKTSLMHQTPRIILLCMDTNKIKSGLVYVSPEKAKQCPIVSFCHTANTKLISETLKHHIIPAYFNGWLTTSTPEQITFLGENQGIKVSINEKDVHFDLIQNILSKTEIFLTFDSNDEQNFWDYFIPYSAYNIFSLYNPSHPHEIAKKASLRQDFGTIINEITALAPETVKINKEQIMNNIYLTPKNYETTKNKEHDNSFWAELSFISETLFNTPQYNANTTPFITQIITKKNRQFLSSVENKEFTLNK